MKNVMRSLVMLMMFCISSLLVAAELGKDYKVLSKPQPTSGNKIEVLEFFFYQCPHCYDMHPKISAWTQKMPADVEFNYIPTIFRDSAEPTARAFYALEGMGVLKKHHEALYQAIHVKKESLSDMNSIADFLATQGVDKAKFAEAYNSFTVQSKIMRAKQMIRNYMIEGTPTIIVNGKYVITGLHPERAMVVLSEVVEMARKEKK